jgi:hypothetical protein
MDDFIFVYVIQHHNQDEIIIIHQWILPGLVKPLNEWVSAVGLHITTDFLFMEDQP